MEHLDQIVNKPKQQQEEFHENLRMCLHQESILSHREEGGGTINTPSLAKHDSPKQVSKNTWVFKSKNVKKW